MSQIQPINSAQAPVFSRHGRELSRIAQRSEVDVTRVVAATNLELSVLDGLQAISGQGMQGVAMVTQLENSLVTAVPAASGRLQLIADQHAFAVAGVVAGAARKLCR